MWREVPKDSRHRSLATLATAAMSRPPPTLLHIEDGVVHMDTGFGNRARGVTSTRRPQNSHVLRPSSQLRNIASKNITVSRSTFNMKYHFESF